MKPISIGKFRSLQQCSSDRGVISVLALDHRQNLRNSLRPQAPESVTHAELTAFKVEVMEKLASLSTAVLLDPEFGAAQCVAANAVPGQVGMLIAVEASGYTGDPTARQSGILPGWSVAKVRRMGANAAKLLVYYHPQAATAGEIEELVAKVAADCAEHDLLLFVEPLSYSLDPVHKKLSSEERRQVVIETARRLTPLGVDVLKAEFPLDAQAEPDERVLGGRLRRPEPGFQRPVGAPFGGGRLRHLPAPGDRGLPERRQRRGRRPGRLERSHRPGRRSACQLPGRCGPPAHGTYHRPVRRPGPPVDHHLFSPHHHRRVV